MSVDMKRVESLRHVYARLLMKNLQYFLAAMFGLACMPLLASVVFDSLVWKDKAFEPFILLVIVLLLLLVMLIFLSACLWASFKSQVDGSKKLVLILMSYLMIWFAFGNLYYFFNNTESYLQAYEQMQQRSGTVTIQEFRPDIVKNFPDLWQLESLQEELSLQPTNRGEGYINCLYFSGVTLLTIGYGDCRVTIHMLQRE